MPPLQLHEVRRCRRPTCRPAPTPPPRCPSPIRLAIAARLVEALRSAASQSEDVGERFPEEARRIHRGDAEERAIRCANRYDLLELMDEGIPVLPVPPDKEDLH